MTRFALPLVLALAAGACTSPAPRPPSAPAPVQQPMTLPEALSVEQQWLKSWFHGTPVRIAQRDDGAVAIEVPAEFCFDPGHSSIKPALAAVLDKVAESLRRRPMAHLVLLAAPGDGNAATPLALRRAAQAHAHLRRRGVSATRLSEPTASRSAAVQLRIGSAPH